MNSAAATEAHEPAESGRETLPARSQTHTPRHSVLEAFQSLITLIVIALFIVTFTLQPFRIPSGSMVPTLLVGDFLLVNKEVSRDWRMPLVAPTYEIHRGDLVVFHYPVDPSLHLVKRVIGLPGEHVRLHRGRAYINDEPLPEPYAFFRPAGSDSYRDEFPRLTSADPNIDSRWWARLRTLVKNGEVTVPADSFFVLGDNRNDSEDSRYWGFVPRAAIVGKPFLVYFSLRTNDSTASDSRLERASERLKTGSFTNFARWNRTMRVIH